MKTIDLKAANKCSDLVSAIFHMEKGIKNVEKQCQIIRIEIEELEIYLHSLKYSLK